MATTKRKSRILGEMPETGYGLHGAGLISKRRMGEFEALCHLDVHDIPPRKIKALRESAHVSHAVFAAVLNTSVSTEQKWEAADKKPSGLSLKLLNLAGCTQDSGQARPPPAAKACAAPGFLRAVTDFDLHPRDLPAPTLA